MKVITMTNGKPDLGGAELGDGEKSDGYVCECHRRMGNDFYFLPKDACIMRDPPTGTTCAEKQDWMDNGAERS
jgi:hypothetical protein